MGRKRIRYAGYGNKTVGRAFGIVWTAIAFLFVIIGFTTLGFTGIFGVVWTVVAMAFVGFGIATIVKGDQGMGPEYIIEDEDTPSADTGDVEQRLARLRDLYERRVISAEEYEAQRAEIIKNI